MGPSHHRAEAPTGTGRGWADCPLAWLHHAPCQLSGQRLSRTEAVSANTSIRGNQLPLPRTRAIEWCSPSGGDGPTSARQGHCCPPSSTHSLAPSPPPLRQETASSQHKSPIDSSFFLLLPFSFPQPSSSSSPRLTPARAVPNRPHHPFHTGEQYIFHPLEHNCFISSIHNPFLYVSRGESCRAWSPRICYPSTLLRARPETWPGAVVLEKIKELPLASSSPSCTLLLPLTSTAPFSSLRPISSSLLPGLPSLSSPQATPSFPSNLLLSIPWAAVPSS